MSRKTAASPTSLSFGNTRTMPACSSTKMRSVPSPAWPRNTGRPNSSLGNARTACSVVGVVPSSGNVRPVAPTRTGGVGLQRGPCGAGGREGGARGVDGDRRLGFEGVIGVGAGRWRASPAGGGGGEREQQRGEGERSHAGAEG